MGVPPFIESIPQPGLIPMINHCRACSTVVLPWISPHEIHWNPESHEIPIRFLMASPSFGEIPRFIPGRRFLMVKSQKTAQKTGAANYGRRLWRTPLKPRNSCQMPPTVVGCGSPENWERWQDMTWPCQISLGEFIRDSYWFIDSCIDSWWIIDNDMGSYSYGVRPVYAVCLLKTLIHGRCYLTLWRYNGDTMGYNNKEWCPSEMKPGNCTYPNSKCRFSAGEIIYIWGLCFFSFPEVNMTITNEHDHLSVRERWTLPIW